MGMDGIFAVILLGLLIVILNQNRQVLAQLRALRRHLRVPEEKAGEYWRGRSRTTLANTGWAGRETHSGAGPEPDEATVEAAGLEEEIDHDRSAERVAAEAAVLEAAVKPVVTAMAAAEAGPAKCEAPEPSSGVGAVESAPEQWTASAGPRQRNEFEAKALETLKQIWNWLIVGEEFRSGRMAAEYAIATTWLVRGAILALLTGVGFFLKYSIENGLLNETMRVVLSVSAGMAMLICGMRLARRRYHLIGIGLLGGGFATLYFSVFAAYEMYGLISFGVAFGAMSLITLAAGVAAVRFNALLVALIGTLGGYLTPAVLDSGHRNLIGLFGYLLLLGLGVTVLARFRNWKLLTIVSFLAAYGWSMLLMNGSWYVPETDYPVLIAFLSASFVLFSLQAIAYNMFHALQINALELLLLLADMIIYLALALPLTIRYADKETASLITVALAVFYIVGIVVFLHRRIRDRNLLLSLFSLAAFNLALTFPLLLSGRYLAAAWAIQAVLMLYLSIKIGSNFLRYLAYLLYAVTAGRLLWYFPARVVDRSGGIYWDGLSDRFWNFGLYALALLAGCWLLKKLTPEKQLESGNDLHEINHGWGAEVMWWSTFACSICYLLMESYYMSQTVYPPLRLLLQPWVILGGMGFLYWKSFQCRETFVRNLLAGGGAVLLLTMLARDLAFWQLQHACFGWHYQLGGLAIRLAEVLSVGAVFYWLGSRRRLLKEERWFFGLSGTVLFFIYSSLEVNTLLQHYLAEFRLGGLSVWWGAWALGLTVFGIVRRNAAARYAGLGMFVVTLGKIFLLDLRDIPTPAKVVAFVLLGLVMLAGAFVYIKFKDNFDRTEPANQ